MTSKKQLIALLDKNPSVAKMTRKVYKCFLNISLSKLLGRLYFLLIKKENINCPLCGANNSQLVYKGDRYSMGIETVICNKCKMIYTNPRPNDKSLSNFYNKHYRRFYFDAPNPFDPNFEGSVASVTAKRRAEDIFRKIKPFVNNNIKFLDIGCGEGALLSLMRRSFSGLHLYGCEPDVRYAEYAAKSANANVTGGGFDKFLESNNLRFDVICISHVLEHMLDPVTELKKISKLLVPGGRLYIEVPNMISDKAHGISMLHIAHVVHFIPETLLRALDSSELIVIDLFLEPHLVEDYAMSVICTNHLSNNEKMNPVIEDLPVSEIVSKINSNIG